jgi:hypothetical protein
MQARFASGVAASEQEELEEVENEPSMSGDGSQGIEDSRVTDDAMASSSPTTDAEMEAEIARSMAEIDAWDELGHRDQAGVTFTPVQPAQACRQGEKSPRVQTRARSETDDEEYDRLFLEMIDSSSLNGSGQGSLHEQAGVQQLPSANEWAQMMEDAEMMMDTSGA